MKLRYIYRSLLFVVGIFLIFLGMVGLLLPVVPQVPFFIIGTIFLIIGFKSIKNKILESKFYAEHLKEHVNKSKILKAIFL